MKLIEPWEFLREHPPSKGCGEEGCVETGYFSMVSLETNCAWCPFCRKQESKRYFDVVYFCTQCLVPYSVWPKAHFRRLKGSYMRVHALFVVNYEIVYKKNRIRGCFQYNNLEEFLSLYSHDVPVLSVFSYLRGLSYDCQSPDALRRVSKQSLCAQGNGGNCSCCDRKLEYIYGPSENDQMEQYYHHRYETIIQIQRWRRSVVWYRQFKCKCILNRK
jgi:hypothetical protein